MRAAEIGPSMQYYNGAFPDRVKYIKSIYGCFELELTELDLLGRV